MRVAGIIAEYNPFHNGHQYQMNQIRLQQNADYIIAIMSGNFLQRGVPSILDKYTRTQMALHSGADLVLELPCLWATASAERFAQAGVILLARTGVVDTLCYGAEQPDSALMQALVQVLSNDSDEYTAKLLDLQKQGLSYPTARAQALCHVLNDYDSKSVLHFLESPNNILALEYEKAIHQWNQSFDRKLSSYCIKRIGGHYHDAKLHQEFSSATAIRNLLLDEGLTDEALSDQLMQQVPNGVKTLLTEASARQNFLNTDDFSAALYARLWTYRKTGYTQFADCSTELSYKIQNLLDQYTSFSSFVTLLKTREVTYTRICRVLIHILLDIKKEDYRIFSPESDCAYLRVLGFRKDSAPLLSAIKKEASLPLVTKMADASQILSDNAQQLLALDIAAADLYRSIRTIRCNRTYPNEFSQPICIV